MKILLTYGGTREAIDNVRFITNLSSGNTGHAIASELKANNYDVEVIRAASSPTLSENDQTFLSHQDLDNILKQKLKMQKYDFVIHSAAVSDYTVKSINTKEGSEITSVGGKINSGQNLLLELEPSKKIINEIKSYSINKKMVLIGFKLSDGASAKESIDAVEKLCNQGADYVVYNDRQEIDDKKHLGKVFLNNLEAIKSFKNKKELALSIIEIIKEHK